MEIPCVHFERCSGCERKTEIEMLPAYNEAAAYFLEKGYVLPPLRVGKVMGWRTRAKLAVRGDFSTPAIGLYEKGSHKIVDIPKCLVHHPQINRVVERLKVWIKQNQISLYQEEKGTGALRYVQCSVERRSGKVQLVVVLNEQETALKPLLHAFYLKEQDILHSVWINLNRRRDNLIFGEKWELIAGENELWELICGKEICFHPACFSQGNLEMYEKVIERIQAAIPQKSSVLELYAGTGAIGFCLSPQCKKVVCVERSPQARACFEATRLRLPPEEKEKIALTVESAEDQMRLCKEGDFSVLIVDPPRKGLDRKVTEFLEKNRSLSTFVYLSCGWDSFKRDCDQLLSFGWKLKQAEAFLFFPGTEHLELLAVFERN